MAEPEDIGTGIRDMAEGVARLVFADDYHTRPWWVRVYTRQGWLHRVVPNYATARAWVMVLTWRFQRMGVPRTGYWAWIEHGPAGRGESVKGWGIV